MRPRRSVLRLTRDVGGCSMRLTYRTARVLGEIAEHPGSSNRQVADRVGISDQGQISKLLARLERLGLIEQAGGEPARGGPNAWALTPTGRQVAEGIRAQAHTHEEREAA
jgi:DNA-binding MarR family transcriptional regulator